MIAAGPSGRLLVAIASLGLFDGDAEERDANRRPSRELLEQRERLLAQMAGRLELDHEQLASIREIFTHSIVLGQGNPELTQHPMSRDECQARRARGRALSPPEARCQAPNMVTIYDPEQEGRDSARTCIDQYEFPNIVCEYPVVHVTAREAALLCEALGKRLCDAHEWEGACAGALRDPSREYAWGRSRPEMRMLHNASRERSWAYGVAKDHGKCATGSFKTPGCIGGYTRCGSNTYPAGAFPECISAFGVYDQHGNAAEHMSLPLSPSELARDHDYGSTEMKGSWFIFASHEAHEDDCRWRAPDWHGSRVLDPASHGNYHLGFRCCKDISDD